MRFILILTFVLSFSAVFCQQTFVSNGGEIIGADGLSSVSFSVGEPFCNYFEQSEIHFLQAGVQQTDKRFDAIYKASYESSYRTLSLYPNPTLNNINVEVKIPFEENVEYTYYILSIEGKTLMNGTVTTNQLNQIEVLELASGSYKIVVDSDFTHALNFIKL